ncbi:hypothetical protein AwWohl_03540 [Gammaproteobacteria bacterium]|nr:hypothetical protein AwWohl_03540 [Gammaproteobacteria bacterium]
MIITKINLLSWRAEQRLARMKAFEKSMIFAVIVGAALAGAFGYYVNMQVDSQRERNQSIQAGISKLEPSEKMLTDAKIKVADLSSRIYSMNRLSVQRNEVVNLFTEVAQAIPEETFLSNFNINGMRVLFMGMAEQDRYVTSFNANLRGKANLAEPVVTEKVQTKIGRYNLIQFNMNAVRVGK